VLRCAKRRSAATRHDLELCAALFDASKHRRPRSRLADTSCRVALRCDSGSHEASFMVGLHDLRHDAHRAHSHSHRRWPASRASPCRADSGAAPATLRQAARSAEIFCRDLRGSRRKRDPTAARARGLGRAAERSSRGAICPRSVAARRTRPCDRRPRSTASSTWRERRLAMSSKPPGCRDGKASAHRVGAVSLALELLTPPADVLDQFRRAARQRANICS
jgi:hypothetical protein